MIGMVHVKKWSCEYGRGVPTTEFYIDGKPQIYCRGWVDKMNDEPLVVCKLCLYFADSEQPQKDLEAAKQKCKTCKWYYEWFGVCTNGDSEYCADCPPYPERGCKEWEEKENGEA